MCCHPAAYRLSAVVTPRDLATLLRLSQMEGGGTRVEKALRAGSQEPHVEPTCTSEDSSNSGAGSTEARRHSVGAMPLYGAATCTELREELRRRGLRVSGWVARRSLPSHPARRMPADIHDDHTHRCRHK